MSVIVKGMTMPTSCDVCRFDGAYCYAKGDEDAHSTLPCPLIPVPPHGRLIDADALLLKIDCHGTNKFGILDEDIREFINEVPTIIPAEEGET